MTQIVEPRAQKVLPRILPKKQNWALIKKLMTFSQIDFKIAMNQWLL